uniref:Plasmid encoded RepA protein n=1 Tax=Angiostrongylus cantonensis TaxID=6313 RepID=A0A158P8A6_ANGCA
MVSFALHLSRPHLVTGSEYNQCQQRDPMFRRHCIVAAILETSEVHFLLHDGLESKCFRLIEEYVDTRYDITFYDRFCSWEIAMGSYLVKSTPFSRSFLRNFADYESKLPNSFHGSDNGAIHAYILETLAADYRPEAKMCYSIWNRSNSYSDLFLFEACIRAVLGSQRIFDKVRILRKGTGWVRDIWITRSKWNSERDFMLHGMKESDRSSIPEGVFETLR